MLVFVAVYALVAMSIGDAVMAKMPESLRFGYYAIAGLAWTLPAMILIRWMQKP